MRLLMLRGYDGLESKGAPVLVFLCVSKLEGEKI